MTQHAARASACARAILAAAAPIVPVSRPSFSRVPPGYALYPHTWHLCGWHLRMDRAHTPGNPRQRRPGNRDYGGCGRENSHVGDRAGQAAIGLPVSAKTAVFLWRGGGGWCLELSSCQVSSRAQRPIHNADAGASPGGSAELRLLAAPRNHPVPAVDGARGGTTARLQQGAPPAPAPPPTQRASNRF